MSNLRADIIGALFDAVSAGLRNFSKTHLDCHPRLADYAKFITAAESGLGWDSGSFLETLERNKLSVSLSAYEDNVVLEELNRFVTEQFPRGWIGSSTQLLDALNEQALEEKRRIPKWPKSPTAMGNLLRRMAPVLRDLGYEIELQRGPSRTCHIIPPPKN